uniref:Uncharacterized protein n=1 Tax=Clandestinovirus TaxID=2831644 RepID=A0A8F8PK48_9VIRU|nr:hypothetical protein KOM_12_111 [Clandestinovirus]
MATSVLPYVSVSDLEHKLCTNNIAIKEELSEKDVNAVFLPLAEDVVLIKHCVVFQSQVNKEARLVPVPWSATEKWNCVSIIPVSQAVHDDSTEGLYSPVIRYDMKLGEQLWDLQFQTKLERLCVLYNGYLLDQEMFVPDTCPIKFITMPSHYSVQLAKTDLYPFRQDNIDRVIRHLNLHLESRKGEPCYKTMYKLDNLLDTLTNYTIDNLYLPNPFTFAIHVAEIEPNVLKCYSSEADFLKDLPMLQNICDLIGFTDGHVQPYTLFTKHINFPRFNVSFGKTELYSFCKQSTADIFKICKRKNTTPQNV